VGSTVLICNVAVVPSFVFVVVSLLCLLRGDDNRGVVSLPFEKNGANSETITCFSVDGSYM